MSQASPTVSITFGRRNPSDFTSPFKVWRNDGELPDNFASEQDAEEAAAVHWIELNGNGALV